MLFLSRHEPIDCCKRNVPVEVEGHGFSRADTLALESGLQPRSAEAEAARAGEQFRRAKARRFHHL